MAEKIKNKQKFLDIVISGPDMSGTSTQINDFINYFQSKKQKIKDIRGTEMDLLFHADIFKKYNKDFISLKEFLDSKKINQDKKKEIIFEIYSLLSGYKKSQELLVGSIKNNIITSYINPDSADIWIMEEPTKRGAGQVSRVLEQNRSFFDISNIDGYSASLAHQTYRLDEFYRFRKILREKNKIIIRSRSEESACYQIHHAKINKTGISLKKYLELPGNKIAFNNPPTHIFIVCGPENWEKKDYLKLREERKTGRVLDDHESNVDYQLLVNKRYASSWLDNLYKNKKPKIYRFDIYDSKIVVKEKMYKVLDKIYN